MEVSISRAGGSFLWGVFGEDSGLGVFLPRFLEEVSLGESDFDLETRPRGAEGILTGAVGAAGAVGWMASMVSMGSTGTSDLMGTMGSSLAASATGSAGVGVAFVGAVTGGVITGGGANFGGVGRRVGGDLSITDLVGSAAGAALVGVSTILAGVSTVAFCLSTVALRRESFSWRR
jgi:hypothetical protein